MTALALVAGKLHGEPVTRPTRTGGQFTTFKLRVANGAELEYWDCATFSETVREELAGLSEGDALSAVGALRVELFEWKGEQRIKRSLTADRVLALRPKPKADRPSQAAPAPHRTGPEIAASSWARPTTGRALDDPF